MRCVIEFLFPYTVSFFNPSPVAANKRLWYHNCLRRGWRLIASGALAARPCLITFVSKWIHFGGHVQRIVGTGPKTTEYRLETGPKTTEYRLYYSLDLTQDFRDESNAE